MSKRNVPRAIVVTLAAASLVVGCGDSDESATTTSTTESPAATTTTTSAAPTTTAPTAVQPAAWPAADTTFATPEEAARSFVEAVLGVPAVLGEFQQGDARSGEMAVLAPGEGGGTAVERGTLLLRQLGAEDGWFVLGAVNDVPTIEVPEAPVPAAPLRVTGTAIGFEATVIASAWLPGATEPLDRVVTMAGEMGVAGPYEVELDLSAVPAGSTMAIVVTGGVGLETDPGDFAAATVTIAG